MLRRLALTGILCTTMAHPSNSTAQSPSEMSALVSDLSAYADSTCSDGTLLRSVSERIRRLSNAITNSITHQQAMSNDQLRAELAPVRFALLLAMSGEGARCADALRPWIDQARLRARQPGKGVPRLDDDGTPTMQ